MPLPRSAIERYADKVGFSSTFVSMVQRYDYALLNQFNKPEERKELKIGPNASADRK